MSISFSNIFAQEPFTTIPNRFLDSIAPTLTAAELRVMLYIYRHTLGFHKLSDCISYEQFTGGITTQDGRRLDAGAGVCRQSLKTALNGLQTKGLITRHKNAYSATTTRLTPYAVVVDNAPVKVGKPEAVVQIIPPAPVEIITPTKDDSFKEIKEPDRAAAVELSELIPGLSVTEAEQALTTATRNARTFAYCLALARYVTTNPRIHTPAAAFKALVKQNADRSPAKAPEKLSNGFARAKPLPIDPAKYTSPGGKYWSLVNSSGPSNLNQP